MAIAAAPTVRNRSFSIWTIAFRPFFLAAGVWSAAAIAAWIVMLATGLALPSRFAPLNWHIHEILFGFVMAGVTALPATHGMIDRIALLTLHAGMIGCATKPRQLFDAALRFDAAHRWRHWGHYAEIQ